MVFCFLMLTRPPISTRTTTRLPYTTLFRSAVRYAAVSARYKVYIIDEVHMLSKSAFNALLKTLEEPPAHVKLLFATTEIQKVPVTVLRSEEHTSELQSLMRNSYAVFCLKKKNNYNINYIPQLHTSSET